MANEALELTSQAKHEAGLLVRELELQYGPRGAAMQALGLYERIAWIERSLEARAALVGQVPDWQRQAGERG